MRLNALKGLTLSKSNETINFKKSTLNVFFLYKIIYKNFNEI